MIIDKKSKIYRLFLKLYIKVLYSFRDIQNLPYRYALKSLLRGNNLDVAINKLKENNLTNSYKIYYIIRRENPSIGLLTYVSVFLGHIAYAVKKGYVPVIDMQNFESIYLNKEDLGKKNAWEFYFEQPCGVSLKDIPVKSKIIYSPKYIQPMSPFVNSVLNKAESTFWKKISLEFIRLNNSVEMYVNNEYENLLASKKVLGLLFRGTDYTKLKPLGHPIQPTVEEFIKKINYQVEIWGEFDCYYLATDEERVTNILREKFPGKVVVNKRMYYDNFNDITYLAEASFDRLDDNYLKGLEYLSSIILLSRSNSIIAGLCAGTYAANFMKKAEFENQFFFNWGFYK